MGEHSSDAGLKRATSNLSEKDPETTCSRRCRRWKQRRLCSRSWQGAREETRAGSRRIENHVHRMKKAHLNARCGAEEWVELREFDKFWRYAMLKRWLYGMRKAASGWEDDHARRLVEDGFRRGRAASTILLSPQDAGACHCAR